MKTITIKSPYIQLSATLVVPDELEVRETDLVVFADANGTHIATVERLGGKFLASAEQEFLRLATEEDVAKSKTSQNKTRRAKRYCQSLLLKHNLDIKIINVYLNLDASKMIFYFTSDKRVDFRELVRDLAREYHLRIEMRQIGDREEVAMAGGIGPCGQLCCCKRFLGKCGQASIRMAKTQGLALNPLKINGYCGKLMCCLAFENDTYIDALRVMPKVGSRVKLPDGSVGIVHFNKLLERVVTVECGEDNICFNDFTLDELLACNPSFEHADSSCCGGDDKCGASATNDRNSGEGDNE